MDLDKDKRHVATWKENGWSFYDIAWMLWAVLFSIIVLTMVIGALSIDDDGNRLSLSWVLAISFLFIGALVAWILGISWITIFRHFHLILSKGFNVRPSVMCEEMDRALAEHQVTVKDKSVPNTARVMYDVVVVYVLEDGRTHIYVARPLRQDRSSSAQRTVIRIGPLGKTNADLMESARKAMDSIKKKGFE